MVNQGSKGIFRLLGHGQPRWSKENAEISTLGDRGGGNGHGAGHRQDQKEHKESRDKERVATRTGYMIERHCIRAWTANTETTQTHHRSCADDKNQREPSRHNRIPIGLHFSEKIHKIPASVNPLTLTFINSPSNNLT